jgi:hypothetical protein
MGSDAVRSGEASVKRERVQANPWKVKVKRCNRPVGMIAKALRRKEQHGDE